MLVKVMPELADGSQPNGVRYIRNVAGGKPTWRKHLALQTDRYSETPSRPRSTRRIPEWYIHWPQLHYRSRSSAQKPT